MRWPSFRAPNKPRAGEKKVYGQKIRLRDLLENPGGMHTPKPHLWEINIQLRYLALDLIWRPVGILVRFVAVLHPYAANAS